MQIRPATVDDCPEIEEIARRSLRTSYALGPAKLSALLDNEFARESLEVRFESPNDEILVAEDTSVETPRSLLGFGEIDDQGTLRWLHVRPRARGRGVGRSLVERLEQEADVAPNQFSARSLQSAREGTLFLERFGLYPDDTTTVEIGDERFTVQSYTREARQPAGLGRAVPERVSIDGKFRPVATGRSLLGAQAPFYAVRDDEGGDRIGFLCSQCKGTAVSTDPLERLHCTTCGNTRRPDGDPAYL